MSDDKREQPKPQPGHVWRWPNGQSHTIADVNHKALGGDECAFWASGPKPWAGTPIVDMTSARGWSCVGIETPAGRVMVGERRQSEDHCVDGAGVVSRIMDRRAFVEVSSETTGERFAYGAKRVASWPLLPPLTQGTGETGTEAVMRAASDATREAISQTVGEWSAPPDYRPAQEHGRCLRCGGTPCHLSVMGSGCESGPGIARLATPEPVSLPDVVYTWEAWALP